ncbi:MAG: hypothetical protein ACREXT_07460, partial [Gammaproteobacteria bacterium]
QAENAAFVLPFGGEPGAALAHAYDYGTPPIREGVYTLRVPSVDTEVAAVFMDFELAIDAASKTVLYTRAARAYRSLTECVAAQKTLEPKLKQALPQTYVGQNIVWQYQSNDAHVVGGTYCRQERHLPFPILTFEMTTVPSQ